MNSYAYKSAGLVRRLILLPLLCLFLLFPVQTEAAETVSARIPVSVTGGNPLETFTIVLDMETTELQTPDQLYLLLKAGEEGAFTIQYTYPGTYHYRILQEAGSDSTAVYDTSVYQVDVIVTEDENGVLYADPVVYAEGSSEKKAEITFDNTAASSGSKNSSSSSKQSGSVQTGDSSMSLFYAVLLAGSAAAAAVTVRIWTKKKGVE